MGLRPSKLNVGLTFLVDSVEFTCPEDSDYFPGCSDLFPVCILSSLVCDGIVDCDEAGDEVATLCDGKLNVLPIIKPGKSLVLNIEVSSS